jgi:hypothetical protein
LPAARGALSPGQVSALSPWRGLLLAAGGFMTACGFGLAASALRAAAAAALFASNRGGSVGLLT